MLLRSAILEFHSENRDDDHLSPLHLSPLHKRKKKLEDFIDALPEQTVQRLASARPRPMGGAHPPTPDASEHALTLLLDAQRDLAIRFGNAAVASNLNLKSTGQPFLYTAPIELEPGEQHTGVLPLVHLCCEELALRIYYPRFAHDADGFPSSKLAANMSNALLAEYELWVHQAGQARIPYPFVYWALQHIVKNETGGGHASLCIRCGELIPYYVRKRRKAALLCRRCTRKGVPREWPVHAVMPHTHAQWWLKCQAAGCTEIFPGSAQARRCEAHRSARITPGRRAALMP